jgi:predicted lipoprotein with Yx(FWY)xxD motif
MQQPELRAVLAACSHHRRTASGRRRKRLLLGSITRADGTTQVTYAGHPLYRFLSDKNAGDVTGQGLNAFGAPWYVVSPSGAQVG